MRQDGSSLPDRTPMQMEAKHQRTLRRRRRVKLIPMIEEGNQSSVAGAFIIDDVRHSRRLLNGGATHLLCGRFIQALGCIENATEFITCACRWCSFLEIGLF
uniref:Uncharacterized protein n=1 Tax=Triticum urartu TaxID=4572 RepID=A0A8R7Q3E3_TRIUA